METGRLNPVLRAILRIAETETTRKLADGELIRRFSIECDEISFKALVRRHGAMVFHLCLRILGDEQDAEDAFQATFLVLTKKAGSVTRQGSIGSWLFGVAYRICRDMRKAAARRQLRERRLAEKPSRDPLAEISVREAQETLDSELALLPDKLRGPLILCCVEGLTRDEAGQQLGLSVSVVKARLEQAREMLRARLARRGLTFPAAWLVAMLSQQAVAATVASGLVESTVKAATSAAGGTLAAGGLSAKVVAITEGALKTMMIARFKCALGFCLAGAVLAAVTVGSVFQVSAGQDRKINEQAAALGERLPPSEHEQDSQKLVDKLKKELAEALVERDLRARQAEATQQLADRLKEDLAKAHIDAKKALNEARDAQVQVIQLTKELAATREALAEALKVNKERQKKNKSDETQLEAFVLQNVRAKEVANELQQLLGQKATLRVAVHAAANTIIVQGTLEELDQVRKMIRRKEGEKKKQADEKPTTEQPIGIFRDESESLTTNAQPPRIFFDRSESMPAVRTPLLTLFLQDGPDGLRLRGPN